MLPKNSATIAARATAPGCAGVGIIRVSGGLVPEIARKVLSREPQPRYALFSPFFDSSNNIIDQGLALYFPAPNSFTGEDILELHGHGSPVVLDSLLNRVLELGARLANPGEFTERAFLNNKIDLAQAEAIADLISASSKQAALSALRSLQGKFSHKINAVVKKIIDLRKYIEASIDFSEEEIDFLPHATIEKSIKEIINNIDEVYSVAGQGVLLKDGINVVIAGEPNVGKSSLLNRFCGYDSAIVTPYPGTTRDVLREYININGLPLHIIDTAGLRESDDVIEQEGVKRTWQEMEKADFILLVTDKAKFDLHQYQDFLDKIIIVRNKIDLTKVKAHVDNNCIYISVKTGEGIDLLEGYLQDKAGFKTVSEGSFIARRRHLDALKRAKKLLINVQEEISSLELLAEDLRMAQNALGEITGEFYSDDLLDLIFSEFCVGK